jgi:aspergillopepsin I
VFNTRLPEKSKVGHAIFDPAKSTTFTPLEGFTFEIRYGDGSFANGGVGIDTVDIGGATVARQAIGLPTEVSESFSGDSESDGLVGLAFTALNTFRPQQQKTFLDNIAEDLSEPVFTAQLKAAETGVYEFGNIDTSKFVGDLIDVPVDASGGFWSIESTMFVVGESNGTLQTVSQGATAAIADTGTTLMLVNDEIMEAYYAKVPNSQRSTQAGGFIFPCGTTLPDLLVSVGGTHLVRIPGSLAEFAPVGTDLTSGSQRKLCSSPYFIICTTLTCLICSLLRRHSVQRGFPIPGLGRRVLQVCFCSV